MPYQVLSEISKTTFNTPADPGSNCSCQLFILTTDDDNDFSNSGKRVTNEVFNEARTL